MLAGSERREALVQGLLRDQKEEGRLHPMVSMKGPNGTLPKLEYLLTDFRPT